MAIHRTIEGSATSTTSFDAAIKTAVASLVEDTTEIVEVEIERSSVIVIGGEIVEYIVHVRIRQEVADATFGG